MIICSKPYECKHYPTGVVCAVCENGARFWPRTMTNADRIRAMSDEEMAAYMGDVQTWGGCPNHGARNCTENCADCWLDWLKQEAKDNA